MIKLAILICAIRQNLQLVPDKKFQFCQIIYASFIFFITALIILIVTDQNYQFYLYCCGRKKACLVILVPVKKYQFYPHSHRLKLPILTSLSQIKIASFIFIVTYQNCQFYPYCCSWKKPVLLYLFPIKMPSLSQIKIAFYPYCCGWKKPVFLLFSQIKNASFIFIIKDPNCQFYPYCQRS